MSIRDIIEKDGYVTRSTNRIAAGTDKYTILTRFLESINRPATINELIEQTQLSNGQVRGALLRKDLFVDIGRTVYDLAERQYEDATIVDLVVKILTAENHALKINVVIDYIMRYKIVDESAISSALLGASEIYFYDEFVLLAGWPLSKIQIRKRPTYEVKLDDAILGIINNSDEVFDYEKTSEALQQYGASVSHNPNSIKSVLSKLADRGLLTRVGGTRTGCYTRNIGARNRT